MENTTTLKKDILLPNVNAGILLVMKHLYFVIIMLLLKCIIKSTSTIDAKCVSKVWLNQC